MLNFDEKSVEEIIGYEFSDKELLRRCFIHSSYSNEHKGEESNEKLEFLGDAVIELIISEKLFSTYSREGEMTEMRQKFVSDESLRESAEKIGIEKFMLVGGSGKNLGKKAVPSLMEAVVAGIYLDGGIENARKFVLKNISVKASQKNAIGILQELAQSKGQEVEYSLIEKTGKDNAPTFRFSVSALGYFAEGEGDSKSAAKKAAAEKLIKIIDKNN